MYSDDDVEFLRMALKGSTNIRTNYDVEHVTIVAVTHSTFKCKFADGEVREISRMDVGSPFNEDATEAMYTTVRRTLTSTRPGVPDRMIDKAVMETLAEPDTQYRLRDLNEKGRRIRARFRELTKNNQEKAS